MTASRNRAWLHALILIMLCSTFAHASQRLLIFSKTKGYRHASIEIGVDAIAKLCSRNGFSMHHTEDAHHFTTDQLADYHAIIFLNTSGNVLNEEQQAAMEKYIQNGGGFVGIHSATDTEYDWPWYGKLVGAYFESHPKVQEAVLSIVDRSHAATAMLPAEWKRTDEWYNFKQINQEINVLITLDESSYQGGKNGKHHPFAWFHEYDGGRAFYTLGGHTKKAFEETAFLSHLWGGILYAAGDSGHNTLTEGEKAAGWKLLFDGKTTNGWRNFKDDKIGSSWKVENGTLTLAVEKTRRGRTKAKDGGDIITTKKFENFELSLEWKISSCGNSGVMFNVVEGPDYQKVYHTGPEMQILDNTCHPDAKIHTHRAADLYDLIPCRQETVKPAGSWNHAKIKIEDGSTSFHLNGVEVVTFQMFDDLWADMIAKSKFKDMPGFGQFRKGHIALQDHGDAVSFRNIKIRTL